MLKQIGIVHTDAYAPNIASKQTIEICCSNVKGCSEGVTLERSVGIEIKHLSSIDICCVDKPESEGPSKQVLHICYIWTTHPL